MNFVFERVIYPFFSNSFMIPSFVTATDVFFYQPVFGLEHFLENEAPVLFSGFANSLELV